MKAVKAFIDSTFSGNPITIHCAIVNYGCTGFRVSLPLVNLSANEVQDRFNSFQHLLCPLLCQRPVHVPFTNQHVKNRKPLHRLVQLLFESEELRLILLQWSCPEQRTSWVKLLHCQLNSLLWTLAQHTKSTVSHPYNENSLKLLSRRGRPCTYVPRAFSNGMNEGQKPFVMAALPFCNLFLVQQHWARTEPDVRRSPEPTFSNRSPNSILFIMFPTIRSNTLCWSIELSPDSRRFSSCSHLQKEDHNTRHPSGRTISIGHAFWSWRRWFAIGMHASVAISSHKNHGNLRKCIGNLKRGEKDAGATITQSLFFGENSSRSNV